MDPHPTITVDHYSSSNTASTSTSLHSKIEKNEGYYSGGSSSRSQQQQHKSPSSKSSSQLVSGGSGSHNNTGAILKQHSSPTRIKGKQSKNHVPVRQRSVSPPTTSNNFLLAADPHSARRSRRKSVCAVLIAPPSPTTEDLRDSHSDTTIRIKNDGISNSNMPDLSIRRTTMDFGTSANQHGSSKQQHGHRKHSTPKHSPNASPRGSKSNLAALSSSLMDTIHKANLCMRRKSSPVISEELSTIQISSLRGSLALADALSSTSNNPPEIGTSTGKQRKSSKQSGYSGGSPVYVETSSGMVELRRKDHNASKGYNDNSRRLSSPSSLEKGKYFFSVLSLILIFI